MACLCLHTFKTPDNCVKEDLNPTYLEHVGCTRAPCARYRRTLSLTCAFLVGCSLQFMVPPLLMILIVTIFES